jgi:hypothetical protein
VTRTQEQFQRHRPVQALDQGSGGTPRAWSKAIHPVCDAPSAPLRALGFMPNEPGG